MADQRSVLKEFRFLDEKRRTQGLSRDEQARLDALRDLVGEAAPAAPRPGFDVNAAAARLRDSLLPAGLRNRPPPTPEVIDPEADLMPEEPALDAWAAPSPDAAAPFDEPEVATEPAPAEPLDPLFDPASLADDGGQAAAQWDPNAQAYDPNAVAAEPGAGAWDPDAQPWDPNAAAYDPNAQPWDANAAAYDPNGQPWDPNAAASYDPNAQPYDPNAAAYAPEAQPWDPNAQVAEPGAQAWDPNTGAWDPDTAPYDPSAPALDPNAQPWDPNAAALDPNAQSWDPNDPNAAAYDPGAPALDPNAQSWDANAASWDPNEAPWDPNAQAVDAAAAAPATGAYDADLAAPDPNAAPWDPAEWAAGGDATTAADPSALPEVPPAAAFGDPGADAGFDPSAEGTLPPLDLAFEPATESAPELGAYDELAPANVPGDAAALEALLPFDAAAASAIGPADLNDGFDGASGDFLAAPRARGPYDDTAGFEAPAAAWPDPPPPAPEPNAFEAAPQLTAEASAGWQPESALEGGFALASHGSFDSDAAQAEALPSLELDATPATAAPAPEAELPALDFDVDADTAEIPTLDGDDLLEELPPEDAVAPEPTIAMDLAAVAPAAEPLREPEPLPEPEPEPVAEPEPEPPATATPFIAGTQRVVVHTVEGHVKRGVLEDVDLGAATFALKAQPGAAPEAIDAEHVKAIFFMLGAGERPPNPEGQRVRVTFRDGRQVAGFSPDYAEGAPGFFMIPADTRTSTGRIWVRAAAVKSVTVG